MPHTLRTVTGIAVGIAVGVAATSTLQRGWTLFIRWVLGRGD